MRVLVLGPEESKAKVGGVVTHTSLLVRMLRNLQQVEYVDVFDTTFEKNGSKMGRIKCIVSILNYSFHLYDLIFINASIYTTSLLKLGFILKRLQGVQAKILVQFHGGRIEDLRKLERFLVRISLKPFLGKVQKIYFLTSAQKETFEKEFSFEPLKTELTANYIEVRDDFSSKSRTNIKVLFLSRLEKEKGIEEFLMCAQRLAQNPQFSFCVAGEGSYTNLVKNMAQKLPNLRYCGKVFGEEKENLIKDANVFCLLSEREAFPYALLENMAYGNVPIVTDIGEMKHIVTQYQSGFVIEKDAKALEQILYLIASEPLQFAGMAKRAYQTVKEQYSVEKMQGVYFGGA